MGSPYPHHDVWIRSIDSIKTDDGLLLTPGALHSGAARDVTGQIAAAAVLFGDR
ncbi:hypothetical protein [Streptomyces guryensis]|uniref:Uncharacterized protein n=1 Tax=Streptomyces guryensis TaxID=2886947 RepID=A0A9Q3Z5Y8_9ACTN|nr:hypothetical protein [Streptomyces guryensis]MCD9872847.1 hypothetical protein [Streptomyces guryensis]